MRNRTETYLAQDRAPADARPNAQHAAIANDGAAGLDDGTNINADVVSEDDSSCVIKNIILVFLLLGCRLACCASLSSCGRAVRGGGSADDAPL